MELPERRFALVMACAVLAVAAVAMRVLQTDFKPRPGLAGIQAQGELVALTVVSPTTVYQVDGEWTGFEHDLVQAFGDWLGVSVRYRFYPGIDGLMAGLEAGDGHLAAAGLTVTERRRKAGVFGPVYQTVKLVVICARRIKTPRNLDDLESLKIVVPAASSYVDVLEAERAGRPGLAWTEIPAVATEDLFAEVESGAFDCTVADRNIVDINQLYHPDLRAAFELPHEQAHAWLLPHSPARRDEPELLEYLDLWFGRVRKNGLLPVLEERYYGHLREFDYVEVARFVRRIRSRLPEYEPRFRAAAARYGLPWTTLAAQSYQESKWNPRARSRTGVRGIMMLTRVTAAEVGVKDRLDVAQSIDGGSRYLRQIYDRLPAGLTGEDRLWSALAAYNVGFYHLLDARRLAERQGLDKDAWRDLRRMLPLLSRRKFYKTVPHGRARGGEPVIYVDRIREFEAILKRELEKRKLVPQVPTRAPMTAIEPEKP